MKAMPNPSLTRTREMQQNITMLAGIEARETPFVSCYLDLSSGAPDYRQFLAARADELRATLADESRGPFDRALNLIRAGLADPPSPETRGRSLFARSDGSREVSLSMSFAVPLENRLTVYRTPDIFPLLQLQDTFGRYMLLLVQPGLFQLVEINLGAATTRAWVGNSTANGSPESLRWPEFEPRRADARHLRPQRHVRMVERLVQANGRMPLILAGDPELTGTLHAALPASLRGRVIDRLPIPVTDDMAAAVAASMRAFVDLEERESRAIATDVVRGARARGLAVAGGPATLGALREGRADTLVMVSTYRPGPGWACDQCGQSEIDAPLPSECPDCHGQRVRPLDLRAELARLAARQGLAVEVVDDADDLMAMGGVGCLLRLDRRAESAKEATGRLPLVA